VHSTSWFGVVAPPKTPLQIANRLSTGIAEVLHTPEVTEKLHTMSFAPVGNTPAAMAQFLAEESVRWRTVIAAVGIKPK